MLDAESNQGHERFSYRADLSASIGMIGRQSLSRCPGRVVSHVWPDVHVSRTRERRKREEENPSLARPANYISVHDPAALSRRVSEGFTDSLAAASGWYAAESRTVI